MLRITIENNEFIIVKPVYNRIDAAISKEFKEELLNLISLGEKNILIDLENVEYIDSLGLSVLISILKVLKGKGEIILTNLNEIVTIYFNLTRMDRVFKIYFNK